MEKKPLEMEIIEKVNIRNLNYIMVFIIIKRVIKKYIMKMETL